MDTKHAGAFASLVRLALAIVAGVALSAVSYCALNRPAPALDNAPQIAALRDSIAVERLRARALRDSLTAAARIVAERTRERNRALAEAERLRGLIPPFVVPDTGTVVVDGVPYPTPTPVVRLVVALSATETAQRVAMGALAAENVALAAQATLALATAASDSARADQAERLAGQWEARARAAESCRALYIFKCPTRGQAFVLGGATATAVIGVAVLLFL